MPTQIKHLFIAVFAICIHTTSVHAQQQSNDSVQAYDKISFIKNLLSHKSLSPEKEDTLYSAIKKIIKEENITIPEGESELSTNQNASQPYDKISFIKNLLSHKSLSKENEDTIYSAIKRIIAHENVEYAEQGGEQYNRSDSAITDDKTSDVVETIVDTISQTEENSPELIKELTAENEKLTQENIQQQQSKRLGQLTTILSIALITILSLLTLSLYKNNNLRARANELLQNKNTELLLAKENAEKASEARVQFLSTITHELRTPLYAVTGLTHLLLEESPTENQKEHLNSLKFSGEYLLSLINNILDLNKLEANKVEIEHVSFNLKKRITDVLIALRKSAKDRNNKLHYDFESSIPTKLKGDPLKISQILINLIGNSIKFTQNGDIWIRVHKVNQIENKVFLNFEIEDNGVGISEKKQKSIFENFTQGSVQINRKFGGTGLGLSIVKNLLNLMGSEIKLESELGRGSKFVFDLKFEIYQEPNGSFSADVQKIDPKVLVDKRVLVVEDNKINQLITRKILEKNHMICDVADNGDMAVEKVKKKPFDLILMDIHMPGISGIEATKLIREFNTEIPIIALTAVTLDENLDEFYDNGFDDIIPKPYKTEEFFIKLHKGFTKNDPQEETEEEEEA